MIIKITPGKTLSPTEVWTPAKFNQGFNPTAEVEPHSVGEADLDAQAVRDIINGSAAGAASAHKNFLINGSFEYWQRGSSFTITGAPARYFTADRWATQQDTPNRSISRNPFPIATTVPPGNPHYYLRWAQTAAIAPAAAYLRQFVEEVTTLAGKQVTLSVYINPDDDVTLVLQLVQNFGTGGAPSANVGVPAQAQLAPANVWTRVSATFDVPEVTGKTLGTDGNDALEVRFVVPSDMAFEIRFSQAQLEQGDSATPFELVDPGTELIRCQRYYEVINTRLANGITTFTPVMYYKVTKRKVVQPQTVIIVGDPITPYAQYFTALDTGSAYQSLSHALASTTQAIDAEFY